MKISVILPTYNAAATLEKCLQSLLAQTLPLHEIIVVDDGSTDESLVLAEALARESHAIQVHRQPNGGVSEARNRGLSLATGDYIGFVDPDDHVNPDMYQEMAKAVETCDASVVALREYTIRAAPSLVGNGDGPVVLRGDSASAELLKFQYPSGVWCHLYARNAIGSINFDSRIGFFEDLLFNFELLRRVDRVACISGNLYNYTPGPGGANRMTLNDKHLSSFLVCERLREVISREGQSLDGEIAQFEASCLSTMIYKAPTAPELDSTHVRRIRDFARRILRGCLASNEIPMTRKALVLAAGASTASLSTGMRKAILLRRKMKSLWRRVS